jgi:hypothetical protein
MVLVRLLPKAGIKRKRMANESTPLKMWLEQCAELSPKKLGVALATCDKEMIETVDDLRKMAVEGTGVLIDELGFKKIIATSIVAAFDRANGGCNDVDGPRG